MKKKLQQLSSWSRRRADKTLCRVCFSFAQIAFEIFSFYLKKSKRLKIDALLFCCAARGLLANSNTRRANICAVSVHSVRTTEISTHNNRHEGHEAQLLELIFSICVFHQLILICSSDLFSIHRALANSHLRFVAGSI